MILLIVGCGIAADPQIPKARTNPAPKVTCEATRYGARLVPDSGIWFGVNLDWARDSPAAYGARLGRPPAVVTEFAVVPFIAHEAAQLDRIVQGLAQSGGMLLLTLEPRNGLEAITDAVADQVALRLARYNVAGVPVFLRFAHEMNGSWYPWSQRPRAYIASFRRLARAVHAHAPLSAMLWAPNYGGGYPFTDGAYMAQRGSADATALDTNHDARLDHADDPYAPYYPGDDVVDWVGMSLYHWGHRYPWGENELPEPDKFARMLSGTYRGAGEDESHLPDFYAEYGQMRGKPVGVFETAAFYAPANAGVDEAGEHEFAIKSAWWTQVYAPDIAGRFPLLRMINWFEWDKYETEVHTRVKWGVTMEPRMRHAFRATLPGWARFAGDVHFCR